MFPLSLVVRHAKVAVRVEIRLWRIDTAVLGIGLAVAPARAAPETPLEASAFRTAPLDEQVSRSLTRWLDALGAEDLVEQPEPPDGLTMTLVTSPTEGVFRRAVIGAPRGRAAAVLGLVVSAAAWQTRLLGRGDRAIFDVVRAELRSGDGSAGPRPSASREPVRLRVPTLGIDAVEVGLDESGPYASDGVRRVAIHHETRERVTSMVAALVATRTARMGAGEHLFEVSFEGARVEVRCPGGGGEPLLAKLPIAAGPTVRSLVVLAGALAEDDDAQRARDLSAWTATLPWSPRPVRTDDLLLRFRMNDVRHGRIGEDWYRLETHGTILRCEAAAADAEGRPVMPHAVSREALETIRAALARCDALGVGARESATPRDAWPDDDSFIELIVQRPSPRGLETTTAAWAYGPMAPRDRDPEMERALEAVYALYQALVKIRGPADIC